MFPFHGLTAETPRSQRRRREFQIRYLLSSSVSASWRRLLSGRLARLISSRAKITERLRFQNKLRRDRRSILAAVKTDSGARTFKQHCHRHQRFFERRKAQIPRVAALLVIKNSLFVLSDDFSLRVFFDHDFLHWLSGFRIDYGHVLLRCARLAPTANSRGYDGGHGARSGAAFR